MKHAVFLYHGSLGQIGNTSALIDTSTTGNIIEHELIGRNHWPKKQLTMPIYANNGDGTPNEKGML